MDDVWANIFFSLTRVKPEPTSNIFLEWRGYADMKHSDWLKIVVGLQTANTSVLLRLGVARKLYNLFVKLAPVL